MSDNICEKCGGEIPYCDDCNEPCGGCSWYHESGMCVATGEE